VNQTHLAQTSFRRRDDVFVDHRFDVTRSKRVEVQRVFNRDTDAQGLLPT
jgi:hypothetical protein